MPDLPPDGTPAGAPPGIPLTRRAAREARTGAISVQSAPDVAAERTPPQGEPPQHEPPQQAAEPEAEAPEGEAPPPASIEGLFGADAAPTPAAGKGRHDRDRRKSRVAAWVVFGVVIAIIGGIGAGAAYVWATYEQPIRAFMGWEDPKDYEDGLATGEVTVTIVSGDTGATISRTLYEAGVTMTPDAFYDHLIETAQNPTFMPGVYALQQKMTSAAALEAIKDPANRLENSAQLREGLTVAQTLQRLADGVGLPLEELEAAVADPSVYGVSADSLEGWLFPATYTFDPGVTATQVIQRMVDRTVESLDAAEVPVERRQEILTIASIIEREARYEDDFYKVSRVIQNRLDPSNRETSGLLQMDSTAQYGYNEMHSGSASSSAEALEDDNPWNTYVHPGLPVGPIANSGDRAIDAAMHPADGPWLYFVTVDLSTGETVFTETFAEHQEAVKQWRAWCRENPDGGC